MLAKGKGGLSGDGREGWRLDGVLVPSHARQEGVCLGTGRRALQERKELRLQIHRVGGPEEGTWSLGVSLVDLIKERETKDEKESDPDFR